MVSFLSQDRSVWATTPILRKVNDNTFGAWDDRHRLVVTPMSLLKLRLDLRHCPAPDSGGPVREKHPGFSQLN
jgi:hypothetical protein